MAPYSSYDAFVRALEMGNTLASAAALVGIGVRTAYRWKRDGRPGVGGRRANSAEVLIRARALRKIAKESRRVGQRRVPLYPTAPRIAARYKHLYGVKMHPTTCIRLLSRVNCRSYVRPRHPNLKNSDLRYKFAREWYNRSPKNIVFSDEHFVSTNDNTNRRMFATSRDAVLPRERQRRQNVPNFQIWGAIGFNYKSKLVFFPKTDPDDDSRNPGGFRLNASSYVRRCLSTVSGYLCSHDVLFMHDGARCHAANSVRNYLQRKGIRYMTNFPAHSPDLNPIECVWALLDAKIAEKLTEQTDAALMAATKAAWDELDQDVINAFVMSFRSKCRRVVASKGI